MVIITVEEARVIADNATLDYPESYARSIIEVEMEIAYETIRVFAEHKFKFAIFEVMSARCKEILEKNGYRIKHSEEGTRLAVLFY